MIGYGGGINVLYRKKNGVPGKIVITDCREGNWYRDCIGNIYDALIVSDIETVPSHIIMDTEYNRKALPSRLLDRLPEKATIGLTVDIKHAKTLTGEPDNNEVASELLEQKEWL